MQTYEKNEQRTIPNSSNAVSSKKGNKSLKVKKETVCTVLSRQNRCKAYSLNMVMTISFDVKFEVLMVVIMKSNIFCNVTPYSLVGVYQ
jgi:hypothetical protein